MKKSRVIWWGALGVLIGLVAIDRHATRRQLDDLRHKYNVIADAQASRTDAEGSRTDDASNLARAQVALLTRAANATIVAPQTTTTPASAGEGSSSDLQPPPKRKEHTYTEHAAHVEEVLAQESRDPSWSQAAESQLTAALAPLAVGNARIGNVTCASTLCRVSVKEANEDSLRDLLNRIFDAREKGGWKGSVFTAHDPASPPDAIANVVFFSKENQPIPFIVD